MTVTATTAATAFSVRLRRDATAILTLGLPLLGNNMAVAGMGFADTVMAGRLGPTSLGAVAVGSSYYLLFLLIGLGTLMALSPTVAHEYGAGRDERVGSLARQALWLSQMLALPLVLGLLAVRPVLTWVGTDPALVPDAVGFVHAIACGFPAMLAFLALRYTSEGIGLTRPIFYTAVAGLATNVTGNWVFMYGKFGFPALGAVGTGVASAVTMWLMFLMMLTFMRRQPVYRPYALFSRFEWPDGPRLREILKLGLPICGSVVSEGGLFVASALLMSALGAVVVAAHQIAINYASLMFMMPLALHSATTIHVGHAMGRGDREQARFAGYVGIATCGALMALSAIAILFLNEAIAGLYTSDVQVRTLAAALLLLASVFQVSDGLQVGAAGALRGYKDARVPMLINVFAYWGIGFPLAWGLGVAAGQGARGVWIGLIAGLTVCALLLNWRYRVISKRATAHGAL